MSPLQFRGALLQLLAVFVGLSLTTSASAILPEGDATPTTDKKTGTHAAEQARPDGAKAYREVGEQFVKDNNCKLAIEPLKKAVETNRRDGRAWFLLGQCYFALGAWLDAQDAYIQARQWLPVSKDKFVAEQQIGEARRKYDEARAYAEQRRIQQAAAEAEQRRRDELEATRRKALQDRYADGGAGIIRDTKTGLEWTQADIGRLVEWPVAQSLCPQRGPGWRLPEYAELKNLFDSTKTLQTKCGVDDEVCAVSPRFRLTTSSFWSSSVIGGGQWIFVDLADGRSNIDWGNHPKGNLCVRG